MLEREDFIVLENMMRNVVAENNEALRTEMSDMKTELKAEFEQKMSDMEDDIKGIIKEEIEKSESFLLDEMERYYLLANEDIQELKEKVDRIDQYYSVRRTEDDECNLKLKHLQMEVDCIKEKLAM